VSDGDEAQRFRAENDTSIPGFDADRMTLYERGTAERGPRELLITALDRFTATRPVLEAPDAPCASNAPDMPKTSDHREIESAGDIAGIADMARADGRVLRAMDLGCGLGQETELLLQRGWWVTASDASARMLECTHARAIARGLGERLTLIHAPFERTTLAPSSFDLVHAGFALPFCPAMHFESLWSSVVVSLRPGGLFVGQFFGPDDAFVRTSSPGDMSVHDASEVTRLLAGFEVLDRNEINRPGETAPGLPKHWHVQHVIARRRAGVPR